MSADTASATAEARPGSEPQDDKALGFWLYLMSDAIIFALLFGTYVVMAGNTAGGPEARSLFSLPHAFTETMLLLVSSITFGMAAVAARSQKAAGVLGWLLATFLFGLAFVILEVREFQGMLTEGAGPDRSGFLSAFFTLVGTHGAHVSAGLVWILVMMSQILAKGLTGPVASRLFRLGLFWHFLDIIWIGIFSVVYLPGALVT